MEARFSSNSGERGFKLDERGGASREGSISFTFDLNFGGARMRRRDRVAAG